MIILPPKEIEDKIKFIHNDVVAIDGHPHGDFYA